jgi:hypothetical protein
MNTIRVSTELYRRYRDLYEKIGVGTVPKVNCREMFGFIESMGASLCPPGSLDGKWEVCWSEGEKEYVVKSYSLLATLYCAVIETRERTLEEK